MKKKIIHIVCIQHFDLVWRRSVDWYTERRRKIYSRILQLLRENPEMTFNINQAMPFRIFIGQHPEEKPFIREMLHAGRLEIAGGEESIPDLNMTSASAMLVNIESGLRFWREEFDYRVRIGSFEDAFGVPDTLPGVVAQYYDFFRGSRMPRPGLPDVGGDYRLVGKDGTCIRCVSPEAEDGLWGWGSPQNPDDPNEPSPNAKQNLIRRALEHTRQGCHKEHSLFVLSGEEHLPQLCLPQIVRNLNAAYQDTEFRFSTLAGYYNALTEEYWNKCPVYQMTEVDFSRLFTGCYVTRRDSKRNAKLLEDTISGIRAAGQGQKISPDDWQTLYYLQFHDAICGCHIDSDARWMKSRFRETAGRLARLPRVAPWQRCLPELHLPKSASTRKTGRFDCGEWSLSISADGHLEKLTRSGQTVPLPEIILREEHGTLWTEEYSSRRFAVGYDKLRVIGLEAQPDACRVELRWTAANRFLDKWPGFGNYNGRLEFVFNAGNPGLSIRFRSDLLGNSTEVSLHYPLPGQTTVEAGQPLGSHTRTSYTATLIQGESFPAYEYVDAGEFAIFHHATPSWALRDGGLENIMMRSPVKRWAPWFPVTPTLSTWDNGELEFHQLLWCEAKKLTPGKRYRMAREFQLQETGKLRYVEYPQLAGLPDNLAIIDWDGEHRLVLLEIAGQTAEWHGVRFTPHQLHILDNLN